MAGPTLNYTLFPPIFRTSWMPAFDRTTSCRVYFSLSEYNSRDEIKYVQITVRKQNSNLPALRYTPPTDTDILNGVNFNYPTGIKITTQIKVDEERETDDRFYVEIEPKDLESGEFEVNEFYKIQIRFVNKNAETLTPEQLLDGKISSWLVNEQQNFSEWSTICIIKGIDKPKLIIRNFDELTDNDKIFSNSLTHIVGRLQFPQDSAEKEYMKSYRIKIWEVGYEVYDRYEILIYDSDIVYTEEYNPNEINHEITYKLKDGVQYIFDCSFVTNNGYEESERQPFIIIRSGLNKLNAKVQASPDNENGRVAISITALHEDAFYLTKLNIRRSCSSNNFMTWEDVHTSPIMPHDRLEYTWYDYTAQPGVWYKYCAQRMSTIYPDKDDENNSEDLYGAVVEARDPVMLYTDDMFLTRGDMQLRIRFDPKVSSMKTTFSESRIETIGSRYPFFKRNSNIEYKVFPISGTITRYCDDEKIFISDEDCFGDVESQEYYKVFNKINNISEYQDWNYEREFRNKIVDFLHGNNVKLFRSLSEGNILVKLMDISFTPNEILGRRIYSFSATAYEIDECTIDNYFKYGIINLDTHDTGIPGTYNLVGQFYQGFYDKQTEILKLLQEKHHDEELNGYNHRVNRLRWARIEFLSEPYPITPSNDNNPIGHPGEKAQDGDVMGWIVIVNTQPIVVQYPRDIFELRDDLATINDISFPCETYALVDYIVEISKTEVPINRKFKTIEYLKNAGQLADVFEVDKYLMEDIYYKYYGDYPEFYNRLLSIDSISIEADYGIVVYIRDSYDDTYCRHVIGPTQSLTFDEEEDVTIFNFYFHGLHLFKKQYNETEIEVNSIDEIENPLFMGVYKIAGTRMIYYKRKWYEFTNEDDILCPVEAIVNYVYEVAKGVYV